MVEIHLPTKVTQDSIKNDTQYIKGQFPISGGTDFVNGLFSSTTILTDHHNNEILKINGEGIITVLSNGGTTTSRKFSVKADDGDIFEIQSSGPRSSTFVFVPFKTSIEIYVDNASDMDIGYILF